MPTKDIELFISLVSRQIELWNRVDGAVKTVPRMSAARLTVLNILESNPAGIGVTQLAREQNISDGAASKLCDRLTKDGLITRCSSPTDGRAQILRISPTGHAALKEGLIHAESAAAEFFSRLSLAEREELSRLLTLLRSTQARC